MFIIISLTIIIRHKRTSTDSFHCKKNWLTAHFFPTHLVVSRLYKNKRSKMWNCVEYIRQIDVVKNTSCALIFAPIDNAIRWMFLALPVQLSKAAFETAVKLFWGNFRVFSLEQPVVIGFSYIYIYYLCNISIATRIDVLFSDGAYITWFQRPLLG